MLVPGTPWATCGQTVLILAELNSPYFPLCTDTLETPFKASLTLGSQTRLVIDYLCHVGKTQRFFVRPYGTMVEYPLHNYILRMGLPFYDYTVTRVTRL